MTKTASLVAISLLASTCHSFADIFTVDDNGPADFYRIQDAIDAASNGDEIIVAPGRYIFGETLTALDDTVVDTQGKAILLRSSHGPHVTFIDGRNVKRCISIRSGEGRDTQITGFTLCNGDTHLTGAGMYIRSTYPTVSQCIFKNNQASSGPGLANWYGNPEINDCIFINNSAQGLGGAVYNYAAEAVFHGCHFEANQSDFGGASYSYQSDVIFSECTFIDNHAALLGGAMAHQTGNVTITDCVYVGNFLVLGDSVGGAVAVNNSTASVERSAFVGNESGFGGAINIGDSSSVLSDCSFVSNHARVTGGALFNVNDGTCMVHSCAFKANTAVYGGSAIDTNTASAGTQTDIEESLFCENEEPALTGPWSDLGANTSTESCPVSPDISCDGVVNGRDLALLLANWGPCEDPLGPCIGDLDDNLVVNGIDLTILLAHWIRP